MDKNASHNCIHQYTRGFLGAAVQQSGQGPSPAGDASGAEVAFYLEGKSDGLGSRALAPEAKQNHVDKADAERSSLLAALRKELAACDDSVPAPKVYARLAAAGDTWYAVNERRLAAAGLIAQIKQDPELAAALASAVAAPATPAGE
jgi:hypothetical protein